MKGFCPDSIPENPIYYPPVSERTYCGDCNMYTIGQPCHRCNTYKRGKKSEVRVPYPDWDCCGGDVAVECADCGEVQCGGCARECQSCGGTEVLRDCRWDGEEDDERLPQKTVLKTWSDKDNE